MKKQKSGFWKTVKDWLPLSFGGWVGGLLFFCLSYTPSLLPRGYFLQGLVGGLSFAIGYGLGIGASILYHKIPAKRRGSLTRTTKFIVLGILGVLVLVFMVAGYNWQQDVREITEAPAVTGIYAFWILLIAIITSLLLIWLGRGVNRLSRFFGRKLSQRFSPKIAMLGGTFVAALLLIFLVNGVLFRAAFNVINYSFGLANKGTPEGIYQPQDSLHSGSPESVVDWNSLGEKGREFVATAPSREDITVFSGGNASQPSRLYVGLESAATMQERADLLVDELERTNAAEREAVLIAIPTGSGGINARAVQSVEYLLNGDTTTLGIQYSYLPSWLSFLADQDVARQTGRTVTEAIYNWWDKLDPADRPKLLMYGESLGTLGADGAFSGVSDIQNRMSAVLLAGPPHANQLWNGIVANRDEGTRQVLPTYQNGEAIRFSDGTDSTNPFKEPVGQPWDERRIGVLQNASDPVVWGSFSLFWEKPDWLREERGSDVLSSTRWFPFVTGWQVVADLPFAFGATPGHGHRYDNDLAGAWAEVLGAKLSQEKLAELQRIIDGEE